MVSLHSGVTGNAISRPNLHGDMVTVPCQRCLPTRMMLRDLDAGRWSAGNAGGLVLTSTLQLCQRRNRTRALIEHGLDTTKTGMVATRASTGGDGHGKVFTIEFHMRAAWNSTISGLFWG